MVRCSYIIILNSVASIQPRSALATLHRLLDIVVPNTLYLPVQDDTVKNDLKLCVAGVLAEAHELFLLFCLAPDGGL